jgi:tetratricopeptide (TPR) repeat protein
VAVGLIREGLAAMDASDTAARARVTAGLAMAVILEPGDENLALAEEADRLATAVGDVEAMNRARFAWAWGLRGRGRPAEMEAVARQALEAAAMTPRRIWEGSDSYLLGIALVGLGDLDGAAAAYEHGSAGVHALTGWAPAAFEASLAACRGRWDDALGAADRAHDLGAAVGDTNEAVWCGQRCRIDWARGRLEEALVWTERAEQTALGAAASLRAILLAELGEEDAAIERARRWEHEVRPLTPAVIGDHVLWLRAHHLALTGDRADAEELLGDLAGVDARLLGSETAIVAAPEHLVGLAAAVADRPDDAVEALATARRVYTEHDFPVLEVRAAVEEAAARLGRGGPGDGDVAAAILGEAAPRADALAMPLVGRRARDLRA